MRRLPARDAHNLLQHLALADLKAHPLVEVYVPVPLHFIFVGFSADGNFNVNLPPAEIQVRSLPCRPSVYRAAASTCPC
jgi:hypothetical protein